MARGATARSRRAARRASSKRGGAQGASSAPDSIPTIVPSLQPFVSSDPALLDAANASVSVIDRAALERRTADEAADAALAMVTAAVQDTATCSCGHPPGDHLGARGPCQFEDGRGTCSCNGYALTAAAGDVVWGPEDGFQDLLCDLNELVRGMGGGCVVDVSLALDKALVACWGDGDGYSHFVAVITVGGDADPMVAPRGEWVPAEQGWVEVVESYRAQLPARPATGTAAAALLSFSSVNGGTVASSSAGGVTATLDAALPADHTPGETLPPPNPSPIAPAPAASSGEARWQGTITLEGTLTCDGRAFAPGAITWRELPLTLAAMLDTPHADVVTEARACGRIDRIWRQGNSILAEGVFDSGDFGQEIARMVADGTVRGVSVDTAIQEFEFGPRADYFSDDGEWLTEPVTADVDAPEDGLLDLLFGEADTIFVITAATIGAVTVCPFAAFEDARIETAVAVTAAGNSIPNVWTVRRQAGYVVTRGPSSEVALVAAATEAPVAPPAGWFADPGLDGPTPLTVDDDGRIFGHAWAWNVCHIGISGVCTMAPHTLTGNSYFHLGEIVCADGERLAVGHITLDTGHAGQRLGWREAAAHYDNTGTVVADVIAREDEHGCSVAGALRPNLTEEQLRAFRASKPSGDWRNINANLELVGLLQVNVPGFPVPRALAAGGVIQSMTAAGVHIAPDGTLSEPIDGPVEGATVEGAVISVEGAVIAALAESARQ